MSTHTIDWTLARTDAEWAQAAADFRAAARDENERRIRSIQDSDTDGFLSQWAHQQIEQRYLAYAATCEARGRIQVPTLFRDGQPVVTRLIDGQYGTSWGVVGDNGRIAEYIGMSHASTDKRQAAHYAKKGYTLGEVLVAATVDRRTGALEADWTRGVEVVTVDSLAETVGA